MHDIYMTKFYDTFLNQIAGTNGYRDSKTQGTGYSSKHQQ